MIAVMCLCRLVFAVPADVPVVAPRSPERSLPAEAPEVSPLPRPRRDRSRRTLEDLERNDRRVRSPNARGRQPRPGALDLPRPTYMRRRLVPGAVVLGAGIGFGSGFFYAGDTTQGVSFALVDAVLWTGLAATFVAFNQLVIRNDFRTRWSLARGERPFGKWETIYYGLGWTVAGSIVASHVYQGIGGSLAARRTNRTLLDFAIVPLGEGGAASFGLRW